MITVELLAKALPPSLRSAANQHLADHLNTVTTDQIAAEAIRDNFLSYTSVLQDGRFKTEDYLNAVKYVSFKLMGSSNEDAYFKTFPQRYQALLAKGTTKKDISSYVAMYNKNKLVNLIFAQAAVPTWVLNQDIHQQAINRLATLMTTAVSEKVQADAAIGLLTHLAKPKEAGPLINIDMRENSGMAELTKAITDLAQGQLAAMRDGVSVKQIAAQDIMDVEAKKQHATN